MWVCGVRPEGADEWAGLGLKPKQRALLVAYAACGSIRKAAKAADVARNNHGRWLKDEKYAEAFEAAKEIAGEVLEEEARHRAIEGIQVPVYYKGKIRGYRRCRSDTLLIFLLKGNNPEKFGDRLEATHHVPEPIPVNVNLGAELMRKVLEAGGKPGVPGVPA
ncbi:MAG TPA: hypothetical protein VMY35_14430 [Phycisphaerae bacterium]|nr:hypothetical protein [Phycisphaerae bacterium]